MLIRGHLRPTTWRSVPGQPDEWNENDLKNMIKKLRKCANFTKTAAKKLWTRPWNIIFLPPNMAWNEKTDVLQLKHLVCCLKPRVPSNLKVPWNLALNGSVCRLSRYQPSNLKYHQKMDQRIGNWSSVVFCWIFVRNLAVNMRTGKVKMTNCCRVCAGKIRLPVIWAEILTSFGVWPMMMIRKMRWGVGLSEDIGEDRVRAWKISEEFATVLEEFESVVSDSSESSRLSVFISRHRV